jgi:hypothetical protein
MFGCPHSCSSVQHVKGDWLDLMLSDECRANDVIDRDSTYNALER